MFAVFAVVCSLIIIKQYDCVFAARAALLTGRLPIRNGFYTTNAHARDCKYAANTRTNTTILYHL